MFNFLNFFKNIKRKKGQSLVEYAIIIGVVVVVGFSAASGLYNAARHNFYYGLLPTNSQNISLPDGPNGEKGWFNEDYMGIPKISCSATELPQPTPIEDEDGRTVLVYGVEPQQEIYCQDVSINSVRNNWGSQYKSVSLGTETEKKLSITIWDHFGMTHTTYVLLRPFVNPETGASENKPIARITTQPSTEDRIFLETDDIAVFGTTSTPLPGGQLDAYEWEIVDIGYISNQKQTEAYKVHQHGNNYTNLIKNDPDYQSFNVQIVSDDTRNLISRKEYNQSSYTNLYLGANPKGTRYMRLRVHSTGNVNGVACTPTTCWSDWTQEPIKTGEIERPRAVITAYKAEKFEYNADWNDSVITVRENDNIFLTYTDSINPPTADKKIEIKLENGYTVETNKGLISYKWHLSKLNLDTNEFEDADPLTALQEIDSINTLNTQYTEHVYDGDLDIYGFRFKEGEIGTYCFRLSVRNEDGIWSYLGECDSDLRVPESPNDKSIRYIQVKEKNIPPEFGTNTTTTPTMQGNKTIKTNTNQQVQLRIDVVHPEIRDNPYNYSVKFAESDYTFGEYYWELLDALGNPVYKSSDYAVSNSEILTLPKINRPDTYTLKVRVKDKTGAWNENQDDPNATFTIIVEQVMNEPIHFPYTGNVQTVTLVPGTYKLQLWGAKGGDGYVAVGGNGGYSYGTLTLTETKTIYVYIGGRGSDNTASSALSGGIGGFNGGGDGGTGGGGASDIRINGQALNNRILVAGGGGGSGLKIATPTGSATNKDSSGGAGGGSSGLSGVSSEWADFGTGGSQSSGGAGGDGYDDEANGNSGTLGQGGKGGDTHTHGGGGGGGYYGGGGGGADISSDDDDAEGSAGGGGGSGYVSSILTEAGTIAGNMTFIAPDGSNETGHASDGYGIITPISNVTIGDTWEFTYTGNVQEIELEKGTYKFEVWGAQGGKAEGYTGGKGGYSSGTFVVSTKGTYYVVVGGQGGTTKNSTSKYAAGGYNGGGRGYPSGGNTAATQTSGGGGGATHIAKSSGILSSFKSNKSAVIIVAGGGGGGGAWYGGGSNESSNGGAGGGESGGTAKNGGGQTTAGGTQTTGYDFGQGGTGGHADSGGGGGGWYGGYANTRTSDTYITGGGGGSGYIGGVTNGTTTAGQREGNGYAKITVTGY